jgi:hypothetical protein
VWTAGSSATNARFIRFDGIWSAYSGDSTVGDQPSLWESLLPAEVLRLPAELARVDALPDDPAFFAPYFHPVLGRPSTPAECYLRLMFLKFRYRLGYESLCAEGERPGLVAAVLPDPAG